ncbi:DUF4266 domain-containing protein [Candidatus Woesearchaeota archaeon]|nr:DUF4266 domain-containing protein [Candidatus Woesearchaeota archaeon]
MSRRHHRLLFACLIPLLSVGCVQVAPWQRGHLAKPQMALDPHPGQTAFREHIYGGRESATGGAPVSGGGCGCY